jgi:hypothetical protein
VFSPLALRSKPCAAAPDALSLEDAVLLERHRPYLRYDPQEALRVCSASQMTDMTGNRLVREDGAVIKMTGAGRNPLTLHGLRDYPACETECETDRIEAMAVDHVMPPLLQSNDSYRNRIYGRVARAEDGTRWLQYWFWLYDNPKNLFGWGSHLGDWEMIQIRLDDDDRPVRASYSQHEHGETREWPDVEKWEEDHPVVYLAPFSHAAYFKGETHYYGTGVDNPAPDGPGVLPDVEPFGDWVSWPGRWGGSLGRTIFGKRVGSSPRSPGCQAHYRDPAAFEHRQGRRAWSRLVLGLSKALYRFGYLTVPREPVIDRVVLDGDVAVSYSCPRTLLRRPRHVVISVHDADDDEQPVVAGVRLRGRQFLPVLAREVSLPLTEHVERCVVRVSVYNRMRQRSGVAERVSG